MVPYVDPKSFNGRKNNDDQTAQMYSLNKNSDVFSIGVLLWEISSGKPPFYGEKYDIGLVLEISRGRRETVVLDTPENYKTIYTKCWDGEPDNRPTIHQVVDWLKEMITKSDVITENNQLSDKQEFNETSLGTNNSEPQGDLSQLIQNFDKMNTKQIESTATLSKQENLLTERDFNIMIDETNTFVYILLNNGVDFELVRQLVIDCFNDHNINSQEIYNWLLNNQVSTNSIFLFGYFNRYGIVTSIDYKKAFNLFVNASEQDHVLAQYFVGDCYLYGYGTTKNEESAFKYYEKAANKSISCGQNSMGYCYENGIGTKKDLKMAVYWYEKAANNGNIMAGPNLGSCYNNNEKENGITKYVESIMAITGLGSYCNIDEKENGITKYVDSAIYWYKKSTNLKKSYW
ncbi:hypothetical protein RclHR1_01460014 [Rhizophagus clarus]|nr:hypothetical protein RclHR1_01460014 [Rhizophagus clarus]